MTVREPAAEGGQTSTAWQAAEAAAGVLGPEADVLASVDSAGLGQATMAVLSRAARRPTAMATATMRFWASAAMAGPAATARWLGVDTAPPVPVKANTQNASRVTRGPALSPCPMFATSIRSASAALP